MKFTIDMKEEDPYLASSFLCGKIQYEASERFGYFGMEIRDVKRKCSEIVASINKNIASKGHEGLLKLCTFIHHSGKYIDMGQCIKQNNYQDPTSVSGFSGKLYIQK